LFVNATRWSFTALGGALAPDRLQPAAPCPPRRAGDPRRSPPTSATPSLALGASKWQGSSTSCCRWRSPASSPGSSSPPDGSSARQAALIFTAGLATPGHYDYANFNLTDARSPWSPFHPATTLAVYIWKLNSEGLGQFVQQIANASAAVLIIMVLVFNLGARGLGRLLQRRVTGS
jgi:phosphate transport system permease protein